MHSEQVWLENLNDLGILGLGDKDHAPNSRLKAGYCEFGGPKPNTVVEEKMAMWCWCGFEKMHIFLSDLQK